MDSQTVQADEDGDIAGQQDFFNGVNIDTPLSEPTEIDVSPDGDLEFDIPSSTFGENVSVQSAQNGADEITIGGNGDTSPEELASFAPEGLSGDSLNIANIGTLVEVSTGIGPSDIAVLQADYSLSNVSQVFDFAGSTGMLEIDNAVDFYGTISSFQSGDTIDLAGIVATGASFDATTDDLTVDSASGAVTLSLDPTDDYRAESFLLASDGSGGTEVTAEDDSQPIAFTGSDETLLVANADSLSGAIGNFQIGDTIDVAGVTTTEAFFSATDGIGLEESDGNRVAVTLDPTGNYSDESFLVTPDGAGGTDITAVSPSFTFTDNDQTLLIPVVSSADAISGFQPGDSVDMYEVSPTDIVQDQNSYAGIDIHPGTGHIFVPISSPDSITASVVPAVNNGNGGSLIVAEPNKLITYNYVGGPFTEQPTNVVSDGFESGSIDASFTFEMPEGFSSGFTSQEYNEYERYFYSFGMPLGGILEPTLVDWSVTVGGQTYDFSNMSPARDSFEMELGFNQGRIAGSITFDVLGSSSGVGAVTAIFGVGDDEGLFWDTSKEAYVGGQSTTPGTWSIASVASLPCFVTGTRILMDQGNIPVECLAVGQMVITDEGKARPVKWIGHRRVHCERHPKPGNIWPVRVRADAFDAGMPYRDLWLSPDHAVFVEGVLIPIKHLINGTTIVQEPRDEVTYWHVELEQHDVILAEGLPCESYLDTGTRDAFDNGGSVVELHPDFSGCRIDSAHMWDALGYAPLVVTGPEVEGARRRVNARAEGLGFEEVETRRVA